MKLKITYVPAKAEPQKEIRWEDIKFGEVVRFADGVIAVKGYGGASIILSYGKPTNDLWLKECGEHYKDKEPISKVLGQLSGIEITRGEQCSQQ